MGNFKISRQEGFPNMGISIDLSQIKKGEMLEHDEMEQMLLIEKESFG